MKTSNDNKKVKQPVPIKEDKRVKATNKVVCSDTDSMTSSLSKHSVSKRKYIS